VLRGCTMLGCCVRFFTVCFFSVVGPTRAMVHMGGVLCD
jgi:hypothetical protein